MKKFLVLILILFLTGCTQKSITTTDVESLTNAYFNIFEYLYEFDGDKNDGVDYLAIDLSNIPLDDISELSRLIESYCEAEGYTYRESTFQELVDEGYIVNGGFVNGVFFDIYDIDSTGIGIECKISKYRGNLGGSGQTLFVQFVDGEWDITSSTYWVS